MVRELRKQEVADAVKTYAAKNGKEVSINDAGGFTIMPGDVLITCDTGKMNVTASDAEWMQAVDAGIREILMEMAEEGPKSTVPAVRSAGKITSRSQAGSVPGSALEAVRECQSTEKATYSTGGKRKAASAKTNIAALMEAGGSLEILSMTHELDFIEYKVRAHLGEQYVDSSMAFYRMQYLAKKAWDWVPKYAVADPTLIVGTDENLLPVFGEGAVIKCRITDDCNSLLVPLPAPVAMFKELAREWQSAGRVCETKAYNRASDMILRQSFQGREEISEEQSEVDAINGGKA